MLKKLAAAGAIAASLGGAILGAAPAQADLNSFAASNNGAGNFQVVPAQACRGIDVVGIGAAAHNVLGISNESGPCVNAPVTGQAS